MSDKKKKQVGRPKIIINDVICKRAESLSAQGLTLSQIANVLGISETTLYEKKAKYSEFSEAIKRGKDKGIASITSVLFDKAQKGDNTAIIFYLKNRAGWKDRVENEHIGNAINVEVTIEDRYLELESKLEQLSNAKSKSAKRVRKPQNSVPTTLQ